MNLSRRAVIDVGTNSVKLLVADVTGGQVVPVHEEGRQTRLGRGFYESGRLQPEPIRDTAVAVADFAAQAHSLGVTAPRVIATSAARDALNAAELLAAVQASAGLQVEVISGEQEARWVFAGACSQPALAALPMLLFDTGGGSSEFIVGGGGQSHFRQSFPLGAVRLAESLTHSDPPTADELTQCRRQLREFLDREVAPSVRPALAHEAIGLTLVATGGTASVLAMMHLGLPRFDRERIEAVSLDATQVAEWTAKLWRLPLAARREIAGLPPERADIILFGVAIFEAIMETFGLTPLRPSTRGLRFGALLEPPA
jgi:exopolyphosphatase/guanosine-5'-triphosphate,3'-diphosphate pyrophosphatase